MKKNDFIQRLLLATVLIFSGWILLTIVTSFIAHGSIASTAPFWNDELFYWHEAYSFIHQGAQAGYYTFNELTPPQLAFGTHGAGLTLTYTTFSHLIGWQPNSIVLINNLIFSLSILLLILLTKPGKKQLLYLIAITLTYPALVLYCSTSMSELIHFSLIIVYVGLLTNLIYSNKKRKILFWSILFFCFITCWFRIINIVLFLPVLIIYIDGLYSKKQFFITISIWIGISALLYVITNQFIAQYPEWFLHTLFKHKSLSVIIIEFIKHAGLNIVRFIYPFRDFPMEVFYRYLSVYILIISILKFRKTDQKNEKAILASIIILIGLFISINIFAYDICLLRDYRIDSPILLGSLLLFIFGNQYQTSRRMIILNVICLILIFSSSRTIKNYWGDSERYSRVNVNPVLNQLKFTPEAKSRFENTISITTNELEKKFVLNIPAGIGINCTDTITDGLSTKYIYSQKALRLKTYILVAADPHNYLYEKQRGGKVK